MNTMSTRTPATGASRRMLLPCNRSSVPLIGQRRLFSSTVPRAPCPPPQAASTSGAPADNTVDTTTEKKEDLWQHPDRAQWYLAKWAADDQPDWHPATFAGSTEIAPGVKEVILKVEVSRERVPIRNAYKHIGQRAIVRVNGSAEQTAMPSTPPFELKMLRDGLLRVRGDMTAGETKTASEDGTVKGELAVLVKESTSPELYNSSDADLFEVGPFVGAGLNLRGAWAAVFQFPTIVIFCEGPDGLATARALALATTDVGGLSFPLRGNVRMYYRAPNEASLCYRNEFDTWEQDYGLKVVTSTRDSFQDMFDFDDTFAYDPETSAAIILTGAEGGEEEEAAMAVCKEAEITNVVKQSEEQPPTKYLKNGKEYMFED